MPVNIFSIFIPSSESFFKGLMEGCKLCVCVFQREDAGVCCTSKSEDGFRKSGHFLWSSLHQTPVGGLRFGFKVGLG